MIKKIVKILLITIATLIVVIVVFIYKNKPVYKGDLQLNDLKKKVTIYYDDVGVPHIYAQNQHDVYLALGYVHAQDRLWQMELLRRISAGRLSEIFGADLIKTDKFFLGIGIEKTGLKNIKNIDTTKQSFQLTKAYLNGINQFIEKGATPIEFRLLGIKKEKYTIKDIYNVYGYMAFGFAQAHKTDPFLTNIKDKLGKSYLYDLDINISPKTILIYNYPDQSKNIASSISSQVNKLLKKSPVSPFIGSNSWVIGAEKTKNKKVILANDTHIEFSQPAVWYQSHLVTPDYEFYGFNLALTPFPLMGHNRDYAYGITMFENDDIDFYEESDNQKYQIRKESIKVKDGDEIHFEIKEGSHGPIMNDFLDIIDVDKSIAMDWIFTKIDNDLIDFSFQVSHSNSLSDFKKAVEKLYAPGLNIMYGDAKDNIAWFAAAKLYKRKNNAHSKFILDGSNGKDDQLDYLKFTQNPQAINPPWNYVYSANNQPDSIAGVLYPGYYIPEDRAKRIVGLLKPKNDFSKEDVELMINDVTSNAILELIPIIVNNILKVNLSSNEKSALVILENWGGDFKRNEIAPTIYTKFIYHFLYLTFADEMGEEGFDQFLETHLYKRQIAKQIRNRKSVWWDNVHTKEIKELRDEIFTTSFHQTITELENQFGNDIEKWIWEKASSVTHKHAFNEISYLRGFFNVGPFSTNGGSEVINNQDFHINGSGTYEIISGPSARIIVDFSDVENSVAIIPTGQSGNVFSKHYKDQSQKYLKGEFVKMMMNKEEIEKLKDKLVLNPVE